MMYSNSATTDNTSPNKPNYSTLLRYPNVPDR